MFVFMLLPMTWLFCFITLGLFYLVNDLFQEKETYSVSVLVLSYDSKSVGFSVLTTLTEAIFNS